MRRLLFLVIVHVLLQYKLGQCISMNIIGNSFSQNSRRRGLTVKAMYNIHEPSRKQKYGCADQLQRNAIFRVEALRYATKKLSEWYDNAAAKQNKSNNWMKDKVEIYDYCGNNTHLFQKISNYYWRQPFLGPATYSDASLLEIAYKSFNIPIITASAARESCDVRFVDQNLYTMLLPHVVQLQAIADALKHFHWTYISVVISDHPYALNIEEKFKKEIEKRDICIEKSMRISGSVHDFQNITKSLKGSISRVVVMLTFDYEAIPLIEAVAMDDLIWLVNTGWSEGSFTLRDVNNSRKRRNILTLDYDGMKDTGFMEYFLNLTLQNNNYPWFQQFWSEEFQCGITQNSSYDKICSGGENLDMKYNDDIFPHAVAKSVIDSVYLYNCMLDAANSACDARYPYYTNYYPDYKMYVCGYYFKIDYAMPKNNSNCPFLEKLKGFTEERFIPRDMRFISFTDDKKLEVPALWKYNHTTKKGKLIRDNHSRDIMHITSKASRCSIPCKPSQVKYQGNPKCCFTCLDKLDITSSKLNLGLSFAVSAIGILLTVTVLGIYIKYRNARIIKASSRELSIIILLALVFCFASSIIYHLRPTITSCRLKKFMFGIVFTTCYTPLLLKIIRIYRIFKTSQVSTSKPSLVGTRSQILICIALLGVQLLPAWIWSYIEQPIIRNERVDRSLYTYCKYELKSFGFSVIPCFSLMLACTILASKTRKFPANFNEANSIGLTMYIVCFVWGVFIPAILFFHQKNGIYTIYIIDYFNNFVALITLVGLFFPKCRRVLFRSNTVAGENQAAESRWTVTAVKTVAVDINEESTGSTNNKYEATGSTNDRCEATGSTNDKCEATGNSNNKYEDTGSTNDKCEATGSTNDKCEATGSTKDKCKATRNSNNKYEDTVSVNDNYEATGITNKNYEATGSTNDKCDEAAGSTNDKCEATGSKNDKCEATGSTNDNYEAAGNTNYNYEDTGNTNDKREARRSTNQCKVAGSTNNKYEDGGRTNNKQDAKKRQ